MCPCCGSLGSHRPEATGSTGNELKSLTTIRQSRTLQNYSPQCLIIAIGHWEAYASSLTALPCPELQRGQTFSFLDDPCITHPQQRGGSFLYPTLLATLPLHTLLQSLGLQSVGHVSWLSFSNYQDPLLLTSLWVGRIGQEEKMLKSVIYYSLLIFYICLLLSICCGLVPFLYDSLSLLPSSNTVNSSISNLPGTLIEYWVLHHPLMSFPHHLSDL